MSIGIYKITNLINNKSYIGQSIHIERRWMEHKRPSSNSIISSALKKYGVHNFKFEVIEECTIVQLDKREQYWIQHYNTIVPNGYNVAEDNMTNHTTYKATDKQMIINIISDLKNTDLPLNSLADKYNLNVSTISRINSGKIHTQENQSYPIRTIRTNTEYCCLDCGKKISRGSKRCSNCEKEFRKNNFILPISREELKELIRHNPFTKIGAMFNVSDNTIRKWCDKYELPRKSSQIKRYSDEEWQDI